MHNDSKSSSQPFAALTLLCLLVASPTVAQWSRDPAASSPACMDPAVQGGLSVVPDGAGGAILSWVDYRNGDTAVYAQRLDKKGVPQWQVNGVFVKDGPQYALCEGAAASACFAWAVLTSDTVDGTRIDSLFAYSLNIDSGGITHPFLNRRFVVATDGYYREEIGWHIQPDGEGGAIVALDFCCGPGTEAVIRRLDSNGILQYEQFYQTGDNTPSGCGLVTRTYKSGIVSRVSMEVYENSIGRTENDGTRSWGYLLPYVDAPASPVILKDQIGGALLIQSMWFWTDTLEYVEYFVQRIVGSQGRWGPWGEGIHLASGSSSPSNFGLVADPDSGLIAFWQDNTSGPSVVRAKRFNGLGNPAWTSGIVNIPTPGNTGEALLVESDSAGGAILLWLDSRNGNTDIYAQRIDEDGNTLWVPGGVPICTNPSNQSSLRVIGDAAQGVIVSWLDERNGNPDIYSGRLLSSGVLGNPPTASSFTPRAGDIGTSVSIAGSHFADSPSANSVHFGGIKGDVNAGSISSLTTVAPAGATFSPMTISAWGLTTILDAPFVTTFTSLGNVHAGSFSSQPPLRVGVFPYASAWGDIDGDGKLDLAVANATSNTLSILRNTSTPGVVQFQPRFDRGVQVRPRDVLLRDLDSDGKLDLIAPNNGSNSVSVFRNQSTPGALDSTSLGVRADFPSGLAPFGVAVAEVNNDNRPDIIVANSDANSVSVLKNASVTGRIRFAPKRDFPVGQIPRCLAVADFDGDGLSDIAVTNYNSNTISILRNTTREGSVLFESGPTLTTGSGPLGIAHGDMDADGRPDLVVTNFNDTTVSLFKNTSTAGSPGFASRTNLRVGVRPIRVAVADINGDGLIDFAVANALSNSVSVFTNDGQSGVLAFTGPVDFATGVEPRNIAIGDLDGDSRPDFAVPTGSSDSSVTILRNVISLATWEAPVFVADLCGGSSVLTIGQSSIGTDNLDPLLDEVLLPPTPPSGVFDVRFELPVVPSRSSLRDYRNDSAQVVAWSLRFQPGVCGLPIHMTWDPSTMPEGTMRLQDEFGGTLVDVNMRAESTHTVTNPSLNQLRIVYTKGVCRTTSVAAGWNMVSTPVEVPNMTPQSVFPGAVSGAFRFDGVQGYVGDSLISTGVGYWVKFATAGSYELCGQGLQVLTIPVAEGWNMIGPFADTLHTGAITSTPPGIIESPFYHYEGGYQTVTRLVPGRGYWVNSTSPGVLHLANARKLRNNPLTLPKRTH